MSTKVTKVIPHVSKDLLIALEEKYPLKYYNTIKEDDFKNYQGIQQVINQIHKWYLHNQSLNGL